MTAVPAPSTRQGAVALAATVALVSAAALAYEILLTRVFAIVHWHHLVELAISLALLGYGASGTFLAVFGGPLRRHFAVALAANVLAFAATMPVCVWLAQRVPFDPQALVWDPRQLAYLAAVFLVLAVPFFAAANVVGLALWRHREAIARLYAADLIGAGLGAAALLPLLNLVDPAQALLATGGVAVLALIAATRMLDQRRRFGALAVAMVALAWLTWRPAIAPAVYKDLAHALATLGGHLEYTASGPAGVIEVVRNEQVPLRSAPGMSLLTEHLPPPQLAVFVDGDIAGALADYRGDGATAYLDQLTSALPFAMRTPRHVAVLDAGTGRGVQQALASGAAAVAAVEPDAHLIETVCERYRAYAAGACDPARVQWQTQGARAFVAATRQSYDLITLAVKADPSGVDALRSDYRLGIEALTDYLARLSPDGLLAIDGPTRLPPRLAMRLLDAAQTALQRHGVAEPAGHIAMIRGWQRFTLVVGRAPLQADEIAAVRRFARGRAFDLVWLPGMAADEANRYQVLDAPWFHDAARTILAASTAAAPRADLPSHWQAVDDDRPFPRRTTAWGELWQALDGDDRAALARLDTALLVAAATLAMACVAALALILLPLLRLGGLGGIEGRLKGSAAAYFGLLGLCFLYIELAWIQRLQLLLGHPVYATGAVLATFLVFAGLGSLWSQRFDDARLGRLLLGTVAAILLCSLAYLGLLPMVQTWLGGLRLGARVLATLALLAPLAFALGIPFATGLRRLGRDAPRLVPWAWGVNGCTSVIGAASAPLLAAQIGFSGLVAIAAAGYLILPMLQLEGSRHR